LERVRQIAVATLPPAAEHVSELIPFDPRARKALELTFREALRLGHNYIGTEHILLLCWSSKTVRACSPALASTRRLPRPISSPPSPRNSRNNLERHRLKSPGALLTP
jgi:hypothetical protein